MKVEGGDKIARKLQMLAEETAKKHIRETALEGAEVIRKEAANKAPRGATGILAENIEKEVKKQTKARVEIHIGPGEKAWYGRLVEEGHAKVKGGKRVVKASGRVMIYGGKKDERVDPHPFLRPALDEKAEEAQKVMTEALKARLGL